MSLLAVMLAVVIYDSAPPGRVVSTQRAFLTGRDNPPWLAVLSASDAGKWETEQVHQWHLSLYVRSGTHYHLRYRSPDNGGPLSKTRLPPMREFAIAGTAQLLRAGTDELLVEGRMDSADCGTPNITAIGVSESGRVVPLMSVFNGCALDATVVHGSKRDTLRLTGPYFGPGSGTCCPTKQKATATLSYRDGSWILSPRYFQLETDTYGP